MKCGTISVDDMSKVKPLELKIPPGNPVIAITTGDPAGIGPEITAKAVAGGGIYEFCRPLVIGDRKSIEREIVHNELNLTISEAGDSGEGDYRPGRLVLLSPRSLQENDFPIGKVSADCGRAAFEYIRQAVQLAFAKRVAAIVTGPINKQSLKESGITLTGHTEILAELTSTRDPLTMFEIYGEMRVFFLSRHVSLRQACDMVKKERVLDYIIRCTEALKQLRLKDDRPFAVAGLNPHCGENGLFGREEIDEIIPAIEEARKAGIKVAGPFGADSVFAMARKGEFSAVLSMYHDQGHIAAKTLNFARTVSVTLGMPILRTSVDHGTAFDIAGKGLADPASLIEAVKLAAVYA